MKQLTKYILSSIIISLFTFTLFSNPVFAGIPAVPTTPKNNLTVPTVPQPPSGGEVPTVPPVPTTPGSCTSCKPTETPQPQNPTPTSVSQNPTGQPPVGGVEATPTPGEGGAPGPATGGQEQVLGLSKTSGNDKTNELIIMFLGLFIASFGIRNVISKKLS